MAVLAFIVVSVATPITRWQAFIAYFIAIFAVSLVAKIPTLTLLTRALIEIPFIFFAILMPFFGTGEVVEVGSLNLYVDGLLAGASIVVKGTLGILVAINLSATTTAREILNGLEILKMPTPMVQIASFMLRYVNVVNDEMLRMAVARASRGFEATGVRQWPVLATAAGAAPMIGFLGTTIGMVVVFIDLQNSSALELKTIAPGIMTAMVTTVGGLIVGILAFMGYNFLVGQIGKVVYQMENAALEFMDMLNSPKK